METRFTARRRTAMVLALCLSAFLVSVDVTIVNVALPTLVRSLGATTTQLQWVVDAYSLMAAAIVLAAGSLSDRQGRKGMLLADLGVFAAGLFLPARPFSEPQAQPPSPSGDPSLQAHVAEPAK
jgi:MFS family permease